LAFRSSGRQNGYLSSDFWLGQEILTVMARVFISYSRKDKDFVRKLGDALAAQQHEAWVDWKDIPLTAEWQREIFANIEAAENFLFLISPDSVVSSNCRKEIDHAALNNKRMVPIYYRSVPDETIPEALNRFQRLDFSADDDFDSKLAVLIAALDADLGWVQMHTRLLTRAREWEQEEKDSSFLLRGKDLREAEQWIARSAEKEPKPTTLHSQYIVASHQSTARRHQFIIGAVTAAFLVAVGLAVYAFWQAAVARARQLTASSISLEDTDPELSVLFAAQAVHTTWRWGHVVLPEAESQLHQAVLRSHIKLTLVGHTDIVWSVAWSPDGKRLLTTSRDKTARVWSAETGKELLTLRGHRATVTGAAWSPDGKRVATGAGDYSIKIWDVESGKELRTITGPLVFGLAWSPDGKHLATVSGLGEGNVWDVETGDQIVRLTGHHYAAAGVAWSPEGKRLATGGSEDNTAEVWDAQTGKEKVVLRGHTDGVVAVAWSPNGKRVATGGYDQTARVWDAATGKELMVLHGHRGAISSVSWTSDGKRICTGSADHTIRVWDALSGAALQILAGHEGSVRSVAWSPDTQKLATAGEDRTARVWDSRMDTEILRLSVEHRDLQGVAWSPDGKRLATGGGLNTGRVWDTASGNELIQLTDQRQPVSHLEWSPDGTRLAGINKVGLVSVSNIRKAEKLLVLPNKAIVTSLAWSPDGKRLATASEDKTVGIWDADTGQQSQTLTGHDDSISSLSWSPNSTRLVTVGLGTWAERNGTITFAASTIMWDVQVGRLVAKRESVTPILAVAWSPDGTRLATATQDQKTIISEVVTGKEVVTLNGHTGPVLTVAWSPDGQRLLTGSADKTAKIWDAPTGRELQTFTGQSAEVMGAVWSPSGKKIAVSSSDGVVQIYTTDIHELMAMGRGRVTAHPSQQGCQKYLGLGRCSAYPELPWW